MLEQVVSQQADQLNEQRAMITEMQALLQSLLQGKGGGDHTGGGDARAGGGDVVAVAVMVVVMMVADEDQPAV